jgi:O-antigen ligase
LLITIRSIFSDNFYLSISSSVFYFRFALFSLATIFLLKFNINFVNKLKFILIIIFLTLFFDTIFQYYSGTNILGMSYRYFDDINFRFTSFFDDRGVLGSYISRFFPFLIALFFFKNKNEITNRDIILIIILSIISLILVVLSGERTSLFLLFLGFTLILLTSNGVLKKIFLLLIVPIILTLVISINFDAKIKNRILYQTLHQLEYKQSEKRIRIFGKIYEGHFEMSLKMFKQNPVFGKGVKMFRDFCSKPENFVSQAGVCTTHPHHTYVQLLAETGLSGFVIIFSAFILVTFILFKNFLCNFFILNKLNTLISNYNNARMCLLAGIFITLSPFNPSGNFFNNWLSIIYFFPIGFLLYLENSKKF